MLRKCWNFHLSLTFHSTHLIIDVKNAFLNLLVNLFGCIDERFLDVRGGPCRRLHKHKSMFSRERFALFFLHFTTRFQVTFVADQHNHHVGVGVLTGILEPCGQVIEGLATSDVVDQKCAGGTAVIRAGDWSGSWGGKIVIRIEGKWKEVCWKTWNRETFMKFLQ